ncbi:MAG: ABC transporter substrate-binding protein [Thermoplasmata archaeon]|nr:ABC transporter substrate-binding protein [Thermoplasmata archaeon]
MVISGIGIYFYVTRAQGCGLSSKSPLLVDQAEATDTADPQVAYSTPDWGLVQQIYQTLIMYNQSSLVNFTGVLAHNWTISADRFHWNFTLNTGVHFSNGDPFNAYVMWYSLYRLLALQGIDQYLLAENFWYPGVNYYSNATQVSNSLQNLTTDLNTFDFSTPTASEIATMGADNQSFRVLGPDTLQVNVGFGYNQLYNGTTFTYGPPVRYSYLLAELSTPGAAAVDPIVITANGGVASGTNPWMSDHAMGTGPYVLTNYNLQQGYSISPSPNYWGTQLANQEPWNNNLQPAQVGVEVTFQDSPAVNIADLKSGSVATASFAYLGPQAIQSARGASCVTVQTLSTGFSGAGGSWWVFMNQSVFPFNNLSVRAAITHAINYPEVIQNAFNGLAFPWVGPVPPGSPYYNPANLTPYQFNLPLAQQEIQNSPCANGACKGMVFNYEYLSTSNDWFDAATTIASNLAAINITLNIEGVTLSQFYIEQTIDQSTGQCTSSETSTGGVGPFYIGQDFYSSDYIAPDDWTQENFLSYGSANICNSNYNSGASGGYNATLDDLVLSTAGTSDPALLTQNYTLLTQLMYANYTNAWFAVPDLFAVYNPDLTGFVQYQTPMGSTELSTMGWNTIHAS